MKISNGKKRVVIVNVYPEIDGGIYPIKRVAGEYVVVSADLLADGHDVISGEIQYKHESEKTWNYVPLEFEGDDRWIGRFPVEKKGTFQYTIRAWVDQPKSWIKDIQRKVEGGQTVEVEMASGISFLNSIKRKTKTTEKVFVDNALQLIDKDYAAALSLILGEEMAKLVKKFPLRENATTYKKKLLVNVQHQKNSFSSWYEFFPRSSGNGKHGTFDDCINLLPIIDKLGFDIIYFPPIHPIGNQFRKGKNNNTECLEGEPGSPWAIGSKDGGHKSIHPELGDEASFTRLVNEARKMGIDISLDLAYQCSPDHPYVQSHPEWFKWRADGSVQYAENPPKKYQDVLPFNFESSDWKNLWIELKSIVEYWINKGIRIFRVDNPHTKPFVFWKWLISEIHSKHPEVIFLSEAFTRHKIMAELAKIGFNQSYTYFSWRESKEDLSRYMEELTKSELKEYFRPNFWPNTPDINPYYLQNTGLTHSAVRFVLAATLSSNYGMYGPVFEFLDNSPVPGKEEYLDSEKYEIRTWDWKAWTPFRSLISKVNAIRKNNKAFHLTNNFTLCDTDSNHLLSFMKTTSDLSNVIYVVINLDPERTTSGWTRLPMEILDTDISKGLEMEDLLGGETYIWKNEWNFVELRPQELPCHIFKIKID